MNSRWKLFKTCERTYHLSRGYQESFINGESELSKSGFIEDQRIMHFKEEKGFDSLCFWRMWGENN